MAGAGPCLVAPADSAAIPGRPYPSASTRAGPERPVARRSGSGRAGGAAGAGPSRRAACRRLRGRGRTSLLAGLSRRYVSRGPGAAGSSRRAAASVRRAYPFRSRRCARAGRRGCSGSTRLRYRRDTAGELDSVIGAVEGVSRSSGFAPALPVRFGAGMAGGFCSMRIPVPCLALVATSAIPRRPYLSASS